MQAIAGLGNPGSEYAPTRHNVGWMLLDRLAETGKVLERREKEFVELERLKLGPVTVWLMRNKTYMNSSGLALEQACRTLGVEPRDVLLVYDDVDLPLAQLRLRRGGGSGGHRGVESVVAELGTSSFPRLRLGVRGEAPWNDTADYVLSAFAADEAESLDAMLADAVAAVRMVIRRGIGAAMNSYNQKPKQQTVDPGSDPVSSTRSDKEHRE